MEGNPRRKGECERMRMLTVSTAVPFTEWYCPVVLLGSED